jgi:dTDP-4-amino-4,6-dideoxygalactose transaminase
LDGNEHVWHIYCIRVPRRDEVLAQLNAAGVGAAIHYPVPVHKTGAFADLGGSFPHAEAAGPEILSLPIYPQITPDQQARVVEALSVALTG